jgi:hypothetical protein
MKFHPLEEGQPVNSLFDNIHLTANPTMISGATIVMSIIFSLRQKSATWLEFGWGTFR